VEDLELETRKITASDDMIKAINTSLSEIMALIEADEDIRKILSLLSDFRLKIRSIAEIYDTVENTFVSWLFWRFISEVYAFYAAQPNEFYVKNEENVSQLSLALKNYLEVQREAYNEKDVDKIVQGTAKMVSEFVKLEAGRIAISST